MTLNNVLKFTYGSLRIFLFLFLCHFGQSGVAQETNPASEYVNQDLLVDLIHKGINDLRKEKKLSPLNKDFVLNKAALLQSKFMVKKGELTHFQPGNKLKNPAKRVQSLSKDFLDIAENVAYQSIISNEPVTTESISRYTEKIAKAFVKNWKESLGHYKNIINKKYTHTGISIRIDDATGRIYATQVFASKQEEGQPFLVPEDIYGIKYPGKNEQKYCADCKYTFNKMPQSVQFGVEEVDGQLFFMITDVEWFRKIFRNNTDGIAVDVITKDMYPCDKKNRESKSWAHKGWLLPPVYLKEIQKKAIIDDNGVVYVPVGVVPNALSNKIKEYNILFLQKKHLCRYQSFYNIESGKWGMLEMGMYMDTISTNTSAHELIMLQDKQFKFVIPFEKNKFEYKSDDIKPIYDSLKLTKFNITGITIRAYASVEGSTEHNLDLQQKRANSIARVMEEFQGDAIRSEVFASENWVEFLKDIKGTPYEGYARLSKAEVKQKLLSASVSKDIEPLLAKHRKAILYLELEKKTRFIEDPKVAKAMFHKAIGEKDLSEAMEIQQIIFDNIGDNTFPAETLNELEIPEELEYGSLLNNRAAFRYQFSGETLLESIEAFERLLEMMPENYHLMYNLCVLKVKAWLLDELVMEPDDLLKEIEVLKNTGLPQVLYQRLIINFYIIYSEYLLLHRKYREKDKALRYIYNNYKSMDLKSSDMLNLARYFVSYAKYDWAEKLLKPYMNNVDVEEDLLFYYLNLTIVDQSLTRKTAYRSIMLNAININKKRYCDLFKVGSDGGITIQLLENNFLKKTYCENCERTEH